MSIGIYTLCMNIDVNMYGWAVPITFKNVFLLLFYSLFQFLKLWVFYCGFLSFLVLVWQLFVCLLVVLLWVLVSLWVSQQSHPMLIFSLYRMGSTKPSWQSITNTKRHSDASAACLTAGQDKGKETRSGGGSAWWVCQWIHSVQRKYDLFGCSKMGSNRPFSWFVGHKEFPFL